MESSGSWPATRMLGGEPRAEGGWVRAVHARVSSPRLRAHLWRLSQRRVPSAEGAPVAAVPAAGPGSHVAPWLLGALLRVAFAGRGLHTRPVPCGGAQATLPACLTEPPDGAASRGQPSSPGCRGGEHVVPPHPGDSVGPRRLCLAVSEGRAVERNFYSALFSPLR